MSLQSFQEYFDATYGEMRSVAALLVQFLDQYK